MKTPKFRVWIMGLAVSCLALGGGYKDTNAPDELSADVPPADEPLLQVDEAKPLDLADAGVDAEPAAPGTVTSTNAVGTNAIKMVQAPSVPEDVSPELQEIIKLVQAGLSEEVIMSYITNSTNAFSVDADDLVYLNDLGVSSSVVTAIIQQDNTADARAKKHSLAAVKPLPAGTALSKPATNVYKQGLYSPPANESIPMGDLPPAYEETEAATTYAPPEGEQQPVTVNHFYNYLSPYGSWVDVPDYGLCWRPTVAVTDPYWRPYSHNGRWLWTDHGWYWYSDYSWGWAPFHYGRWASYPGYGWVWAPDTHWGPAWVTWRSSKYYCGWAPLPPRCHYVDGFGLYYRNSSVSISFGFGLGSDCYTFIPVNRFCDRRPGLYYCNPRDGRRIFKDSVVINNYVSGKNNTVINRGIGVDRIAQANRGELPRAQVRRTSLARNGGSRAERLESDGNTPVVVAPTVPRVSRVNGVSRPNRDGNKVEPSANALTPAPSRGGGVANSLAPTPNRNAVGNTVTRNVARANNRDNDNAPERPANRVIPRGNETTPRVRPQSSGNGNVTIAGATPIPSTPSADNTPARSPQSRQGIANRANQSGANRPSSGLGGGLIAGNNRSDSVPRNNVAAAAGANPPSQGGVIRGFSPQSQGPAASAPRSQPGNSGRVFGGVNNNRPQGAAPRSHQSPSVIHVPRQAQSQTYAPAYRPPSAPNVNAIPRSAPSSAPRSFSAPASSAPRAAVSAPSGGGGNRNSGGGGGGGGGGNRGGGGGGGNGNRAGRGN